jgi:hypothetical protein
VECEVWSKWTQNATPLRNTTHSTSTWNLNEGSSERREMEPLLLEHSARHTRTLVGVSCFAAVRAFIVQNLQTVLSHQALQCGGDSVCCRGVENGAEEVVGSALRSVEEF